MKTKLKFPQSARQSLPGNARRSFLKQLSLGITGSLATDGFVVQAQVQPGEHFEEFFQRVHAAGLAPFEIKAKRQLGATSFGVRRKMRRAVHPQLSAIAALVAQSCTLP